MNPVGLGNYNNKGTQIIANEETQLGQNSSVMNNPSLIILKREHKLVSWAVAVTLMRCFTKCTYDMIATTEIILN